jgi:hypothetical protein
MHAHVAQAAVLRGVCILLAAVLAVVQPGAQEEKMAGEVVQKERKLLPRKMFWQKKRKTRETFRFPKWTG